MLLYRLSYMCTPIQPIEYEGFAPLRNIVQLVFSQLFQGNPDKPCSPRPAMHAWQQPAPLQLPHELFLIHGHRIGPSAMALVTFE